MRNKYLPFVLFNLTSIWNVSTTQIIVNDKATSDNNGGTWDQANTNFQDAIVADESQEIVTLDCITETSKAIVGKIALSPNPATNILNLQLTEPNVDVETVSLFDAQGRLVDQVNMINGHIEVSRLLAGFCTVKLTDGKRVYVGKFIKQ